MSKSVNAVIFKAIVLECKVPYKGFTISNGFKSKGIVVEEVFGWSTNHIIEFIVLNIYQFHNSLFNMKKCIDILYPK